MVPSKMINAENLPDVDFIGISMLFLEFSPPYLVESGAAERPTRYQTWKQ